MYLTKIELDPRRRFTRKLLGSPQVMHAVVMKACDSKREVNGDPLPAGGLDRLLTSAATGDRAANRAGRVLWRVDQGDFGVALYVLSPGLPDMTQLEAEATYSRRARTLDYEGFLSRLAEGQTWAFRLAANPVHNANRGRDTRGKRYGHVTITQQRDWLLRRAEKHGFSIPMVNVEMVPNGALKGENFAGRSSAVQGSSGAIASGEAGRAVDPPRNVGSAQTRGTDRSDGVGQPFEDPNDLASLLVVRREKPVFDRRDPETSKPDRVTIGRVIYEGRLRIEDASLFRSLLVNGIGPSKAYGCGLMTLARPRGTRG